MTLQYILIFCIFALLVRLLARTRLRNHLVFGASLLAIYVLQPASALRTLDFWLPTFTILLVMFAWAVTAPPEMRSFARNRAAMLIVPGVILAVALTRYLSMRGILTPSRPPEITLVLAALAAGGLAFWLLARRKQPAGGLLAVAAVFLIVFFLVLKVPFLGERFSFLWRSLMGQNPSLASALEFRWLGFSYIAFRLLHTLRDRQSGRLPGVSLQEYVIYALFFPALTAGPIDRLERFLKDLRQPEGEGSRFENAAGDLLEGGKRLTLGLLKKFVLADGLALFALSAANLAPNPAAGWLWVLLYGYTFQIYFDFSGYTDIALGMGRWLGFNLPENFNRPYLKPNLTQFWNNWHMTLTQWFRGYFFNPLTRALRSHKPPMAAAWVILMTQISTMVLIGLWHGVTWNFVLWGAWHGLGLFIQNRWSDWTRPLSARIQQKPLLNRLVTVFTTLLTFNFVALGWVWFALPTPQLSWQTLLRLFGG